LVLPPRASLAPPRPLPRVVVPLPNTLIRGV
jgi:hypothetical protein